ncbi:hypothetical protein [Solimonas sp. K1W22B-7]|uniref:hypothetical protein n=1 Tax=Solimonas sp. K1W22B-7 TaxID=2303331 RepID=UPI0013C4FD12|nr:hypothetical protein [Solimonas sp. K1W22B-7]
MNELAACNINDLDEGYDTAEILRILEERVSELSEGEAEAQLLNDRQELERWLADKKEHVGWFLVGILQNPEALVAAKHGDLRIPPAPKAKSVDVRRKIFVSVPDGGKLVGRPPFLMIYVGDNVISIEMTAKDTQERSLSATAQQIGATCSPFSWGIIDGSRILHGRKSIFYFLIEDVAFTVVFENPPWASPLEERIIRDVVESFRVLEKKEKKKNNSR